MSFPPEHLDLAVGALSARPLARSARRAGLRALALDLFADADTREHAAMAVRVQARRGTLGFDRRALLAALKAHAPEGLPVVLGAGFEHDPALMAAIARRNPVLGASPEMVARLKDPVAFAALLAKLDIPHPAIARIENAADSTNWLSKRAGASGGGHIRSGPRRGAKRYLQEYIEGRSVSALFLADGARAQILGFSEQWPDATRAAPFRYSGAVGPVPIADETARALSDALDRLVPAASLKGLASADLILPETGPTFVLLEINPRPGATLDVFDRAPWPSLLALHIDACEGRLPGPLPSLAGAFAAVVVHASAPTPVEGLERPHWTADWPSCDETIPAGAPFCTVFAAGQDHRGARRLVEQRRDALLARLPSARVPAPTNQTVTP